MFSQTYEIGQYQPALSPEQRGKAAEQMAISDGENFAWHLKGVFSAHSYAPVGEMAGPARLMAHPGVFWVKDRKCVFYANGVYELLDGEGPALRLLFAYTSLVRHPKWDLEAYKWTYAYVGTKHWFCHPTVGCLIYYDEFDNTWGLRCDECWNGPIYAITHADNRLVVLLEDTVVWSRFDDGLVFDCDWRTGSGAQSLALVRYGQPFSVMPYNNGWLTFTSNSVMLSTPNYDQLMDPDGQRLTVGAVVYRHEEATFENQAFGPCAMTHVDERQVIWLSATGFWTFAPTQGGGFGAVQPWQPLMGRFYREQLVKAVVESDLAGLDYFNVEYAKDCGWLFVSSKTSGLDLHYSRAHVLQLQLDRWGSMNNGHLGVGVGKQDRAATGHRLQDTESYGLFLPNGALARADHLPRDFPSWVRFSGVRLQIPQEESLPAETVTSVQGIRAGTGKPWQGVPTKGNLQSSWFAQTEAAEPETNFDLLIVSSDDEDTPNPDEQEYAQETLRTRSVTTYACHSTGVVHSLIATAFEPGQYFSLRHLELTYFFAGVK